MAGTGRKCQTASGVYSTDREGHSRTYGGFLGPLATITDGLSIRRPEHDLHRIGLPDRTQPPTSARRRGPTEIRHPEINPRQLQNQGRPRRRFPLGQKSYRHRREREGGQQSAARIPLGGTEADNWDYHWGWPSSPEQRQQQTRSDQGRLRPPEDRMVQGGPLRIYLAQDRTGAPRQLDSTHQENTRPHLPLHKRHRIRGPHHFSLSKIPHTEERTCGAPQDLGGARPPHMA